MKLLTGNPSPLHDPGNPAGSGNLAEPGETEEELFRKVLEHGRTYHGMEYLPMDLQERMRKRIRAEKAA